VPARSYHSPAREEQKEQTRQRILQALVRVVLDDGVHAFTMENVARKAGVAHRTVYRHFATREELLEGLSASLDDLAGVGTVIAEPESPDELASVIASVYREFGRHRDLLVAYVITSVALRFTTRGRELRMNRVRALIETWFPSLEKDEREDAALMTVSITSSLTWYHLISERRLSTDRAARAVTWALRTLVDDLARRDRAARKR
jgi:AcrR family transcriptional regulator